jgi:hypothetical protein
MKCLAGDGSGAAEVEEDVLQGGAEVHRFLNRE